MTRQASTGILTAYTGLIDAVGLDAVWRSLGHLIADAMTADYVNDADAPFMDIAEAIITDSMDETVSMTGDLYEYGLAHVNPSLKRELGQYYTPPDVARLMGRNLLETIGDCEDASDFAIIEPSCGCGSLLVPALDEIARNGRFSATDMVKDKLVICDIDGRSVDVCQALLERTFGASVPRGRVIVGDFLADDTEKRIDGIVGIDKAYVLMNPPYGRIVDRTRYKGYATMPCNDLYALFVERCLRYRGMSAIVPQSFTTSAKFAVLREMLVGQTHGAILSYDNVPAPVFCGRKRGITNSNKGNSVRPSIVSVARNGRGNGDDDVIRMSPMLRFGVNDRSVAISDEAMAKAWVGRAAKGDEASSYLPKVPGVLGSVYEWLATQPRVSDLVSQGDDGGMGSLWVPATPRYRTCASTRPLHRSSVIKLDFDDDDARMLAYLTMNSSIAYAWWRFHDGGITLTSRLCMDIPVPRVGDNDMPMLRERYLQLVRMERDAVTVKTNAGKPNESLDFGQSVIDENTRMLLGNGFDDKVVRAMRVMHSNDIIEQLECL